MGALKTIVCPDGRRKGEHMKKILLVAAVMAVIAMTGAAFAALPNATVVVTGTIPGVCHFDTVPAINLNLDPAAGTPVTASAGLTFWCTNGNTWALSDPIGNTGTYAGTLACITAGTCGANTIGYTLTYDNITGGPTAGRTDVKTSNLTATVPLVNFQNLPVGTYSQNVVFTIAP